MHKIKELMEKFEECAKCELDKGIQNVNAKEMGEVVDMIKDCAEAMYYSSIVEAMEETEYGNCAWEDRKFYRGQPRDAMGRFKSGRMRRGYEPVYFLPPDMKDMDEYWRDMDATKGRLYYGGDSYNHMMREDGTHIPDARHLSSRYGYSYDEYMRKRDMYSKDDPEQKRKRTEMLNEYMDDLGDMAKEMVADMSPEEKQAWKIKLNKLLNM